MRCQDNYVNYANIEDRRVWKYSKSFRNRPHISLRLMSCQDSYTAGVDIIAKGKEEVKSMPHGREQGDFKSRDVNPQLLT